MSDDYTWTVLSAVGSTVLGIGAGIGSAMKWFSSQRTALEGTIDEMRKSHEEHVVVMRRAHYENGERLIKLEVTQHGNEERLKDLCHMTVELNKKQDRQMEILLDIPKRGNGYGRRNRDGERTSGEQE